ncbi:hypothetical protein Pmar_PMAR017200 [Perkinsus marinus ATCC 50983]|uniref:Dynein heavy chain linker domain-containing protein n=1 Tax=Perkinsus marinus (strain ATCC 50983 / TXsc) TaxID=423536 RepID=C5LSU5_PERM5|nr:hypothetical protein Pmar_PMAR017200 [Perkinsus marinus ATCC 50983]EER00336.1 hypothetical protein Pmar_PMAR017200 [Perkinsus marinus ATCC 50983]|eukprot:XP_002767618.1 hypothetical protein Pmar_PMAR017200 [Perkinsus marinus ATCC 50983]
MHPKLLSVTVNFNDDGLVGGPHPSRSALLIATPTLADFHAAFKGLLRDTVSGISAPYGDFKNYGRQRLRKFLKASGDDGNGHHSEATIVEEALQKDRRFITASEKIFDRLCVDFETALESAQRQLVEYREIYEYGRAWDEEKFLAKMKFISADGGHSMVVIGCECSAAEPEGRPVDPVALQREMARMTEFIGKVDRLNNVQSVGALSVEARKLKQLLAPIPQRALVTMKGLLLSVLREECKAAGEKYIAVNHELDQRPTKLESFVRYLEMLERLKEEELSELEMAKVEVEDLYLLARQYKMKVSVDDSVKLESLMQLSTDCINSKLPAACEYTRAEKRPMMEELHALAHTLEETARGMRETITDPEGRFMALGEARWAVADQVLEELAEMKSSGAQLKQRMEWAQQSEKFIDVSSITHPFCEKSAAIYRSTLGISLWHKLLSKWLGEGVFTCDIPAFKEACSVRVKPAQAALQAGNSGLMSGGRTSPQSGFDSERYGELYKALVQDIVEVWQRWNCSVLEEIRLLSAKQWETLIEQAGLSLPTKLSAVTVGALMLLVT